MDDELRLLEHQVRAAIKDTTLLLRYVRVLARHQVEPPPDLAERVGWVRLALKDHPERAGIEQGDEVWVEEQNNNWIVGRWRGLVTEVRVLQDPVLGHHLQFRVRPFFPDEDDPDAEPLPFRVKPLPEQRVRGLELAREDRLELIAKNSTAT